jgi:hypothetical protein
LPLKVVCVYSVVFSVEVVENMVEWELAVSDDNDDGSAEVPAVSVVID